MSSSCSSFNLFETYSICTDGILVNLRKDIEVTLGEWELYSIEGQCECTSSSSSSDISSSSDSSGSSSMCIDSIPSILYCEFGGALSCIGTIEYAYNENPFNPRWIPQTTTSCILCEGVSLTLNDFFPFNESCNWTITVSGSDGSLWVFEGLDPLTMNFIDSSSSGPCESISGFATLIVSS